MKYDHNDPRISGYKVAKGGVLVATDGSGLSKHSGASVSKEQAAKLDYHPLLIPVDSNGDEIFSTPSHVKEMEQFSPAAQQAIHTQDSSAVMNKMERFAEMEEDLEKRKVWEEGKSRLEVTQGGNFEEKQEKVALNLAADTTFVPPEEGKTRGKRGKRDVTVVVPAKEEEPA